MKKSPPPNNSNNPNAPGSSHKGKPWPSAPQYNIKEVIPPLNNEIRIMEVLPIKKHLPTTEPSWEVYYADSNPLKQSGKVTDVPEETNTNEANQPPPVLRIGDQLLFLKVGDLVPEHAAGSTQSPIFTVIGAEGLQRVVEDPEEGFENRNILSESVNDTGNDHTVLSTVESAVQVQNEQNYTSSNESNETSSEDVPLPVKKTKQYEVNDNATESLDELLQEAISDLYETTSRSSLFTTRSDDETSSPNELIQNSVDNSNNSESYNDSASSYVESFTELPHPEENAIPEYHLEEEHQRISIEHLPEHNPEYPPIPEDIMILSMTEDTLESGSSEIEFSGASSVETDDVNENINIVKRPVMPLTSPSKHYHVDANSVKILPDILPFIRENQTDESSNSTVELAPEDWLKATEQTETAQLEFNSPLLTLDSALPDSILRFSSKSSNEDDDSKEYIFITNNTQKSIVNVADLNKSDLTTDEPIGQTDIVELEGEFRSPGEPYLIPEWERNGTTEEPGLIPITEIGDVYTIHSETLETEKNQTEEEEKFSKASSSEFDFEDRQIPESTSEYYKSSPTKVPSLTNDAIYSSSTEMPTSAATDVTDKFDDKTKDNLKIDNSADLTDNEGIIFTTDTYNPSTPESSLSPSTENTPIQEPSSTEKSFNINAESEIIRDPELTGSNNDGIHPQKQKKTSALFADVKSDSGKKHNILADLINLVGDVANIGNHDVEVSTVQNSIEFLPKKGKENTIEAIKTSKDSPKKTVIHSNQSVDNIDGELTEYHFSGDKTDDVETPMENDKVEFTTKKTLIDNDSDIRNKWKSTDDIIKDIEIIPKVENKVDKKNPSREKIIIDDVSNRNAYDESSNVGPIEKPVKEITKAAEVIKDIVKSTTKTPEIISGIVKEATKAPEIIENIVKTTKVPEIISVVKQTTKAPEIKKTIVIETTKIPEIITNIIRETTKAPEIISNIDKETIKVPEIIRNTVKETTKAPEIITNLVRVTTKSPEMINKIVKGIAKTPKIISNIVEETTTAPEIIIKEITKTPEKISEIVKETTKAPEVINKIDKEITKSPETLKKIFKTTTEPKTEDVIIYTTIQTSTLPPTIQDLDEDIPKKIEFPIINADPETLISIENIENSAGDQHKFAETETTENSYTSTVMKVSGKNSNMDEQMNILNGSERDKLTKRETSSQLTDGSSQIDDSLISILRGFFEQHFSH